MLINLSFLTSKRELPIGEKNEYLSRGPLSMIAKNANKDTVESFGAFSSLFCRENHIVAFCGKHCGLIV